MTEKRIILSPVLPKLRNAAVAVLAAALFILSVNMLGLDMGKFASRLGNAGKVFSQFWVFEPAAVPEVLAEMLTSLAMAVAALFWGFILSIALSFLAAANTAPSKLLAAFIKGAVAVVRAVPALVWMLMIVASIGFGNTSGMVGLMFPTCGYLIKSFTSAIEDRGSDSIEAMRAVGASWFGIVVKGVLPGVIGPLLSWTSIRLEHNIAESINLGMVGVSGIGAMLTRALGKYDYARISTIIVVIFVVMLAAEIAVNALKRKLNA